MDSTNVFDVFLADPEQGLDLLVHQDSSSALLLLAAGLLGIFGLGLATQAFLRGKKSNISWGRLVMNVGGLAWLLPVAAVFALYGFWMRPSLLNLPDEPAPQIAVVSDSSHSTSTANTVSTAKTAAPATTLPDWTTHKETVSDDKRLVVVTGELSATVAEAEASARLAAANLAREDFVANFPQAAGWEPPVRGVGAVAIRRSFVEEQDRKTHTSGTPFRVFLAHDQVELSPAVRKEILPLWKEEVVGRRIWSLGGLAGLLTLTFATLAVYFRLDDRTAGMFRRRLKLAAVCVIAAGGLAAATLL